MSRKQPNFKLKHNPIAKVTRDLLSPVVELPVTRENGWGDLKELNQIVSTYLVTFATEFNELIKLVTKTKVANKEVLTTINTAKKDIMEFTDTIEGLAEQHMELDGPFKNDLELNSAQFIFNGYVKLYEQMARLIPAHTYTITEYLGTIKDMADSVEDVELTQEIKND